MIKKRMGKQKMESIMMRRLCLMKKKTTKERKWQKRVFELLV
jgi:hypothetical protein